MSQTRERSFVFVVRKDSWDLPSACVLADTVGGAVLVIGDEDEDLLELEMRGIKGAPYLAASVPLQALARKRYVS
jgi:hypothetical protein